MKSLYSLDYQEYHLLANRISLIYSLLVHEFPSKLVYIKFCCSSDGQYAKLIIMKIIVR